jgi:hypothetical protein
MLMEEHKLRMSENRVLKRTFRPKRNKVKVGRRKLLKLLTSCKMVAPREGLRPMELLLSLFNFDYIKINKTTRFFRKSISILFHVSNKLWFHLKIVLSFMSQSRSLISTDK